MNTDPDEARDIKVADALIAKGQENLFRYSLKLLQGAAHCLRGYQYGNASPEAAQEMADALESFLAKLK